MQPSKNVGGPSGDDDAAPRPEDRDTEKMCPRCCGTGLVCGIEPAIGPGACCVDYANAVCPECGGRGKKP
ncbi:hypothetical protein [Desulfosoma sp.]